MVVLIEDELKGVDEEAHWKHVFHRARGRGATTRTASLDDGESEVVSVLFLNLVGFVPFCQGFDAVEVMRTLNQMMSDLAEVLERQHGFVTSYLGGGFMSVFRGHDHAERAVQASLDMIAVVDTFNRPRVVLGLRQLLVRIGIASGSVFLGNIGTYYKMDFTAVGMPVNLASRLLRQADPNRPCISVETYEMVRHRFEFADGNPRTQELLGIGARQMWDVMARKR
jgi:adenylate cyclase